MRVDLAAAGRALPRRVRAALLALAALAAAGGLGAAALLPLVDTAAEIDQARTLLGRVVEAGERAGPPAPLWAADPASLQAAFRSRLDGLAAGRTVLLDDVRLDFDPRRPTLPVMTAMLRGTTEGLRGLLLALETQAPLVVVESAELALLSPADAAAARPTVLRLTLAARGVLVPAAPGPGAPR
ncbi:hypothetical protein [Methylobacterium sp. JK268]